MSNPCSVVCTECRLRGVAWRGKAQLDVQLTANLCPLLPPVIYATHTHTRPATDPGTRFPLNPRAEGGRHSTALSHAHAHWHDVLPLYVTWADSETEESQPPNLSSESVRNRVLFKRNDLGVVVECGSRLRDWLNKPKLLVNHH